MNAITAKTIEREAEIKLGGKWEWDTDMYSRTGRNRNWEGRFLVGAFQDQRSDRFYKLYKLTWTNTKYHTTPTGTWDRG